MLSSRWELAGRSLAGGTRAAGTLKATVLLDEARRGAANPWAVAWTPEGHWLLVTHAGTHELSIIDARALEEKLAKVPLGAFVTDFGFLDGIRTRVELPGDGPRALAVSGGQAYVAEFFRDTIAVVDLRSRSVIGEIPLAEHSSAPNLEALLNSRERRGVRLSSTAFPPGGPARSGPSGGSNGKRQGLPHSKSWRQVRACRSRSRQAAVGDCDLVRKGERLFNDATLCHQGWQSCASCHPDGRADGLNWDLLNDGIGNPKNTRSLLLAAETPPEMSLGVRPTFDGAVRAGLRHVLYTEPRPETVKAIEAYLRSLKPVPSPYLAGAGGSPHFFRGSGRRSGGKRRRTDPGDGKLSEAARRGRRIFGLAGCADCHTPPLFTDRRPHDVGTRRSFDKPNDLFYTPTLIECWRTAPYLHDGSAVTVRGVLTRNNPHDAHGRTSHLSEEELDNLVEYVLSL